MSVYSYSHHNNNGQIIHLAARINVDRNKGDF